MQKNFYLLKLFKAATIIHIMALLANLLFYKYIAQNSLLYYAIEYSLFASVICISIIVSIKAIQIFAQTHRHFVQHYKITAFFIESCIATAIMILLFLNQEITGNFIKFINQLSSQAHNNGIVVLIILLAVLLCFELYCGYEMNRKAIESTAIRHTVAMNIVTISLKFFIIIGTAIGCLNPLVKILDPIKIKDFDSLIFRFTTTDFFLYIHTIIIILVGLWVVTGIYYMYKKYKK
ncbi:hypothetical protein KBC04_04270 [Candidatus Babeliales bacterium]|nr:hypothetical protein [Candidatus Babeliales bacterium]MBP9844281.1 hypothetical protein [Candidatus Babeliales bacterium]